MPIADSQSITFSARTRVFIGEYGTALHNLTHVGLLGGPASLTVDIQYRQKRDSYPRRPVAAAIKSIDATLQAQLEEWQAQNLMWAMGFWQEDVTDHGSREQEVTCLVQFNPQGIAVLPHPVALGTSVDLSGLVEGTDFVTIPRDLEGRTLLYRLDPDLITATATYTSSSPDYRELIIGNSPSRFFTVRLEEADANGHLTVLILHRTRITLRSVEGKALSLSLHALLDGQKLLSIRHQSPATAPHPFVQENLIAAWLFDEGQGTTAHDVSGNDHHLTLTGGLWTAQGVTSGGSARLDVSLPQALEVSAMVVAFASPGMSAYNRLYAWGAYPGSWCIEGIRSPVPRFLGPVRRQDSSIPLTSEYAYNENGTVFCHGFSFGDGEYRGFWNGVLDSPILMPGTLYGVEGNPLPFRIFGDLNPLEPTWKGGVCAMLLYRGPLSPSQWAENYAALKVIMAGRGIPLP